MEKSKRITTLKKMADECYLKAGEYLTTGKPLLWETWFKKGEEIEALIFEIKNL